MKIILLIICLFVFCISAWSQAHVSVGAFRNMDKVQDQDALSVRDPYYPMIQLGYNFPKLWLFVFSPQAFYVLLTEKESNDSYGGDYKVKQYGLIFDLVLPIREVFGIRFGVGNIIRSIEGEGGEVTIPNLSSTMTAYKPEGKSTSYTGTVNFGLEYSKEFPGVFKKIGVRTEYFISSPLESTKRSGYLSFSLQGYF